MKPLVWNAIAVTATVVIVALAFVSLQIERQSTRDEAQAADVILVGMGAMGSVVAPVLARAGLRVVGLEAGPGRGAPSTTSCRTSWAPPTTAGERWGPSS